MIKSIDFIEFNNEPIGVEILSYRPGDNRLDSVSVEMGQMSSVI